VIVPPAGRIIAGQRHIRPIFGECYGDPALTRSAIERALSRREGDDTEWIHWGSGTAHLLPRLIRGREAGPVFLSERRPGAARRPPARPQP
jgi:hypothetical protein